MLTLTKPLEEQHLDNLDVSEKTLSLLENNSLILKDISEQRLKDKSLENDSLENKYKIVCWDQDIRLIVRNRKHKQQNRSYIIINNQQLELNDSSKLVQALGEDIYLQESEGSDMVVTAVYRNANFIKNSAKKRTNNILAM